MQLLNGFHGDVQSCIRGLTKSPGYVATALLALILGVSSATVVFSVINAVLLRSFPYGDPERLVYLWTPSPSTPDLLRERQPFYSDIVAWHHLSHSFEDITAMQRYVALLNSGNTERVGAARVLGNFFRTLKAAPQLGRIIDEGDDAQGRQFVAVISDRLWQSRYGQDPSIIGKTVEVDRRHYRVIGVMPREFSYPHGIDFPGQFQFASLPRTDVWIPAALTSKQLADPGYDGFDAAIGRLRPGVGLSQAKSELAAIEKRLDPLHPPGWRDLNIYVDSFIETALGPVRPLLHLLTGAMSLVLLMACANFASLLFARTASSIRAMSIRTALGAQRWQIVRLVMLEALLLSVMGALVTILSSVAAVRVLVHLNPNDIPRFEETAVDGRVLLFGLALSLLIGTAAAILPALAASSATAFRHSARTRSLLLAGQLAFSVVLLTAAGLLIRSYLAVLDQTKGFSSSTLTMSVLVDEANKHADEARREIMNRIRALPGVEAAGSIDDLPLSSNEDMGLLQVEGFYSDTHQFVRARETGGEYFRAMQIPLIDGRYLEDGDAALLRGALYPKTAVVSHSFVNHYFRRRNPIGNHLRINEHNWVRIVGVVGDVRHTSLEEGPEPIVYFQSGLADSVAIRTTRAPETMVNAIRRLVADISPSASLTDIKTMDQYVKEVSARRKFQTLVLISFAMVALVLTLVGLYGLLSYSVKQRTAEVGLRMAIGASRRNILFMVVRDGLKLVAAGLLAGACLAFALTQGMASLLYGIRPTDPATFVSVTALTIFVALLACLAPARRAARIETTSSVTPSAVITRPRFEISNPRPAQNRARRLV